MLSTSPSLTRSQVPFGGAFKRTAVQPPVAFPGAEKADFDVLDGVPYGVQRVAPGDYQLLVEGTWEVLAQMLISGTGVGAISPQVQGIVDGMFFFQLMDAVALNGNSYPFTVAARFRANANAIVNLYWQTNVVSSSLVAPGGIGCSLSLRRIDP